MLPIETLKKYSYNQTFIETGLWFAEGVNSAIDCGFKNIHSIEADSGILIKGKELIKSTDLNISVNVHLGRSQDVLLTVLEQTKGSCTIFLDAHQQAEGQEWLINNPLYQELEQIKIHSKNTGILHTIMIDDLRCFGLPSFLVTVDDIKRKIIEISENYSFCLERGLEEDDILVAMPQKERNE